jgi:phage shock protein PspC (stress-responsive transcriptional regulator)/predicted membrane protein
MVREPDDRKIAGVCSGLADAVGVDVTVVRVAAVVLGLMTPLVPIGYLIASVVVPERRPDQPRVRAGRVHLGRIPHPLIVVVAIVAVAALVDDAWWLNPFPAAVALVGIGVWLIVDGRDDAPDGPPGPAGTTYADGPPPAGPVDATWHAAGGADDTLDAHGPVDAPQDDAPADDADDAAGSDAGGPAADGDGPPVSVEPEGWWTPQSRPWWEAGQPAASATTATVGLAPAPSRTARLVPAVVAVLLMAGGALWLLTALDIVTLSATGVLAGGLVLIGLALVVGAWRGRAYGLVPLGVVLAALLVAGEALDVPFDAGIGDRTLTVETAAALRDDHQRFLGDLTVDLTGAPLPEGRATEVEASVGVGDLHVIVPRDATVEVRATSRAGDLVASRGDGVSPGRTRGADDVGIDESFTIDGPAGGPRLELDLSTGIGDIEVSHG